jgi:capsid protein
VSGYTDTLFSQSMAGFFHDSKSAVLDNKLRYELVSKSRVLYTQVPLAKAIIATMTRGVVGSGLHLSKDSDLLNALSATYMLDASRQQDLYQLQQQAFETMLLSGECWLIRQLKDDSNYSAWHLAEPDHIFNPPFISISADGFFYYKGKLLIDGIEFSNDGIATAIHYCRNPYSPTVINKKAWSRIPLLDESGIPNVIHLRLMDRPEYPRGLPLLCPLIETLYGLYAYSQAQIQMGILQSCQALVVKTDTNKTFNPFVVMSSQDMNAQMVKPQSDNTSTETPEEFSIVPPNNKDTYGNVNSLNYVSPGQTVHLNTDESLECITPTGPNNNLAEYYNLVLEQCTAALGIPKPLLNGVFDASFSASKASVAQWEYTISKYRKSFIEQMLKPLYRVLLTESGYTLADAYKTSIQSEWLSLDNSMLIDEVRTMTLYKQAFDLGLVTRDEIAQKLFAHTAHEDDRREEFTVK